MSDNTDILMQQILARLTRIETRLMKLMLHEGMRTDGVAPILMLAQQEKPCTILDMNLGDHE